MTSSRLARVRWRNGQILQPDHFRALEDSLCSESFVHGGLTGLPAHGLARLSWNGDAPKNGVVEIAELLWITESGEVLDVPRNASALAPLELARAGRPEVDVYLHAVGDAQDDAPAAIEPAAALEIPRVEHSLVLSSEWQLRGSRARILLGRMKKQGGSWQRLPQVIPPLVRLGSTPYLTEPLRELRRSLTDLDERLRYRMLDLSSRGASIRPVQRARIEARKLDAALSDLDNGVPLHPYLVYARLRDFWLELYMRSEAVPDDASPAASIPAYAHDDLGGCFHTVLGGISDRIHSEPLSPPTETTPFKLVDDRFIAEGLTDDALKARHLYLLIHKPSPDAKISLDGVRLAARDRLQDVHAHMLGVRYVKDNDNDLARAFGPWVDFYRVVQDEANPEWCAVKERRSLAFYWQERFRGVQAALYWRHA
ncbi:type VI secretion system baseplate subunit TssK [Polyangium aurulentum]|uniref:type VI secretion system baseplate subunit TssK n=1 Tax=Polyangium aurulentum TaxID=2567896 RepID=UPI0010AE5418|nr:type VI secretion system baseplate subunit TssK [Polyangium aurulentum]UQA56296.1 type VI secretion system baseplate subunit TssK [Polyangium aurulentum]